MKTKFREGEMENRVKLKAIDAKRIKNEKKLGFSFCFPTQRTGLIAELKVRAGSETGRKSFREIDRESKVFFLEGFRRRRGGDGGLGPQHEVDADPNPIAFNQGRAEGWCGVDAEAQGGVQGSHRLHPDEQVQRQRLVPHLRRQPRGHALDWQVLVRPQPPQVRIRPTIRHPRHLPCHRPRARTPSARRQDPEGFFFFCFIFSLKSAFFVFFNFYFWLVNILYWV